MARPKSKVHKVRLNLDMPIETKVQLESLRDATSAESMSEVIRKAIAVYDFVWQEQKKDGTLVMRSGTGDERQVRFL